MTTSLALIRAPTPRKIIFCWFFTSPRNSLFFLGFPSASLFGKLLFSRKLSFSVQSSAAPLPPLCSLNGHLFSIAAHPGFFQFLVSSRFRLSTSCCLSSVPLKQRPHPPLHEIFPSPLVVGDDSLCYSIFRSSVFPRKNDPVGWFYGFLPGLLT